MKNKIVGLMIVEIVIIIVNLTLIDYANFTWSKNLASFLIILGMIGLIVSMILQIRSDKKQQAKLTDNNR